MKKTIVNKIIVLALAAAAVFSQNVSSVEAKNIGEDTYQVCRNDIFIDYDEYNCKKIVTEIKDDGSFIAVDLGDWLREHDIYDISVEEDEDTGYKKVVYERNQEKEENDEFYCTEDTSYIDFEHLVYEGDVISYTDTTVEEVTKVRSDGSFCTQVEQQPSLPFEKEDW